MSDHEQDPMRSGSEEEVDDSDSGGSANGSTRAASIGRRVLRFLRSSGLNLLLIGLFFGAVGLLALRTAAGNDLLVRGGLSLVDQQVAGEIRVGTVRSANLLRGARLVDVELVVPGGDTLLIADSVEVNYRLRDLVAGRIGLASLVVWGADARIDRPAAAEPGDPEGQSTLQRFIGPPSDPAKPDDESGGGAFVIEDIHLVDGRFRLRTPLPRDGPTVLRVVGEGEMRRFDLGVDIREARIGRVEVLPTGRGGTTVELGSLDARVDALRESIEIRSARAEVRTSARRIVVDVEQLATDLATAEGTVAVGISSIPDVQLQLALQEADLGRIRWISDRIPPLTGAFALQGRIAEGGSRWSVANADLNWGDGEVGGGGVAVLSDGLRLEEVDVRLTRLDPARARDWVPAQVGLPRGTLSGRVQIEGPPSRLETLARVTLRAPQGETTADLSGTLLPSRGDLGFEDVRVELRPLRWESLSDVLPAIDLGGFGSARATLSGSMAGGLIFDAQAEQARPELEPTRIRAQGSIQQTDRMRVDVQGEASPLSLETLRVDRPDLPIAGALRGSFRARGPLDDLTVESRLSGAWGEADLTVRTNPSAWREGMTVEARVDGFEAGRFWTPLGARTTLTGQVEASLKGASPAEWTGDGRARFDRSRVRGVDVDSAHVVARVSEGRFELDTLTGRAGGFTFSGSGGLATDSLRPAGTLQMDFSTERLAELRPALLGDTVIARDTLRALEREALGLRGVDPDTLPLLADVQLDGAASGTVTVTGSLSDFQAEGRIEGRSLVWARDSIGEARLTAQASGLPSSSARVDFELDASGARVRGRDLSETRLTGFYAHPAGDVRGSLRSGEGESVELETAFAFENGGARGELRALEVGVADARYRLQRPTTLVWTDSTRSVTDFDLIREGGTPVRIQANGSVPWRGATDFTLGVERLEVDRLLRLLQREDIDARGLVDGELRITGPAAAPIIEASVRGDSVRWRSTRFDRLESRMEYRERRAELELDANRSGRRVLRAEGSVPIDLSLRRNVDRTVDDDLDLRIVSDTLSARGLLGWLQDLENIEGSVTGEVRVAGRLNAPEASGRLELTDAAWTLGSVGVRQRDVNGTAVIREDGVVEVDARVRAGDGSATATGTVSISDLLDPGFDLTMRLDEFQAVDRLDVAGAVSGDLRLTGRYRQPRLTGDLGVDEGTLYLDEFQRSIGVLDLSDPRFAAIIDTTDIGGRSLLERTQNPFMSALSMDISMDVESNTWLRGRDLQVEIQGQDLIVVYDRQRRDLSLLGDLTVIRGQAFYGSRVFEVEEGTVSFQGFAGINPAMDIVASTRIRRQEGDPLDITVNLGGTLLNPSFDVSTDEQGLSDSDLLSYIAFGRPTTSLTGPGSGNFGAGTAVLGAAGSWLSGTVANQLAALASQELSLIDYLAITQVGDLGLANGGTGVGASFAQTQVEIGRYFSGGEIFGAVVLRPLSQLGGSTAVVGGARMEWQSSDAYHLEAFIEDRFLRTSSFGLSEVQLGAEYVIGFAVVREWGY